ncbi:MAG: phage late control D family protein [Coxiellaceae bacterium]|nr:MAG: phage late control D family protein [Coxiellaceae bacterium]
MEAQFTLQLANQSFDVLQILHAQEGIAQPFEWSLQFQSTDRLTLESWLGEPATLVLTGAWGKQRRIAGYLTQAQSLGITPDQANVIYQATLASPCALLSLQHTNRVFVNQSVIDVIRQVLTEANWVEKVHFQFRLRQDFPLALKSPKSMNPMPLWCNAYWLIGGFVMVLCLGLPGHNGPSPMTSAS